MSDAPFPDSAAQSRAMLICWLLLVAAIFGFGWHKSWENRRDDLARSEWVARRVEWTDRTREELARVREILGTGLGRPASQATLEGDLNDGQPFVLTREGERDVAEWAHAEYGFGFRFEFQGGVLLGWNSNPGADAVSRPFQQEPIWHSRSGTTERLRQTIVDIAVFGWIVAIVGWCVLVRYRLPLALSALAAALAAGMAWLVNPWYSITLRGVFSNDNLGYGALMIVGALFVVAWTLAAASAGNSPPVRIRFTLCEFLLVFPCIAALLAIGPFGYVTAAVLTVGTLLLAVFYYRCSERLRTKSRLVA